MKMNRIFSRSLFAIKDIKQGDRFTTANVRSIRPGYGLHPKHYFDVLEAKAKVDIHRGTPLNWDLIETPTKNHPVGDAD